jgi:hypothetical protein
MCVLTSKRMVRLAAEGQHRVAAAVLQFNDVAAQRIHLPPADLNHLSTITDAAVGVALR